MKKLLRFIKNYKKESVMAPLFKLFEAVLELLVPFVVASIINKGINSGDEGYVIRMCLLLVLFGALGLVSAVTAQYYAAKAATGFAAEMKSALFAHIQTLSYSQIDKKGTSTLITCLTNDAEQVQNGINLTLRLLLRSPLIVFGAMIAAFFIDSGAALVFAIIIPVLIFVVLWIMQAVVPQYKSVQKRFDGMLTKIRENLSGVRVIRAFNRQNAEIDEFQTENTALSQQQRAAGRISALMNPLTFVLINIAAVFVIWIGAERVFDNVILQGSVVALVGYMSQILVELVKMANLIITVSRAVASGSRIQEVFELESEQTGQQSGDEADENAIVFKDVSFRYGAGEEALKDISFCIKKGAQVGIIGSTGSGKTTLINLIAAFYRATSGRVLVLGRDVNDYSLAELRNKAVIAPQKAVLFEGSIRDNLCRGAEISDDELLEALKKAQALRFVMEKGGLKAHVEQGGANFSGGQKQRLLIAAVLARKSEILVFDDSTSALDALTDAAFRRELQDWPGTVITVSQKTSGMIDADVIIVLENGRAVGIGTHTELLETCEVYREIFAAQEGMV